ncbi:MAG TPA: penicillin acylase family protein, partial [Alphaproteobacteria bacterium]|nr:penicillin acylase family protein [Alphaproteobacteria bacterium]
MGKWLWRGLAGLAVLLVVVAGGGYLWLRSSLPHTDGRITVEGLRGPVDIVRDRHDIPHIYAGSQADALYALGFVHAQDRLWQMEMSRRIGAGRLSELLGKATVPTDRLLRMLGLYRVAQHNFAALDADARSLYEAYAGGVNAYL